MWKSLLVMPLLCVGISSCQKTTSVNVCSGWARISMQPATAVYLATNDRPAANGIAAHNAHGSRQGCW